MKNYKLSVSKGGKKYTIVFKAETDKIARERVHKEWYSILSVEEVVEKQNLWNTFLFSAYNKAWDLKNWRIVWDDIFKVYVKLRKDLDYDVLFLFYEKDKDKITHDKKKSIIKDLKEEYDILYSSKIKVKWDEIKEKIKQSKQKVENKLDNFYLKKELEETYKLLDFVLKKLDSLLSWSSKIKIDLEQKDKIKKIYNLIITLKKSTNISKLKEVWELALLKIWKIEVWELNEKQDDDIKKLLKETNFLLKKVWSKKSFVEQSRDISFIINTYTEKLREFLLFFKNLKERKKQVDRKSHSYIKNILFLRRYKQKLKETNFIILKNFYLFFNPWNEKLNNLLLKRKVLKQNVLLFKAKEKWLSFSYTSAKKWIGILLNSILNLINNLKKYLFIVIFLYIFIFILFLNINYYFEFINSNYNWIFNFIILFIIYLILYFSRNLFLIILNFVILFFIVIFWVVNF